jgi:hypothetical protein
MLSPDYVEELKNRMAKNRVYKDYQATGLDIAEILDDSAHKALYMKLAKKINNQVLMGLAKDIAQRATVKNKGAYFMKMLKEKKIV